MNMHFRPPAADGGLGACRVALLDARTLVSSKTHYRAHLSIAERESYDALRSSRRRLEWLAGRLAAKYLFLQHLEIGIAHTVVQQSHSTLLQLSDKCLDDFPDRMYQKIEVLAGERPSCAGPWFRWRGTAREEMVSVSHTGNDVCASLSTRGPAGIDLERVTERADAFHRCNFTETERRWIREGTRIEPLSKDWLFTLLWTVKEAALKAGALLQTSPWSFAGVEVEGLPAPNDVLWAFREGTWRDRFVLFTALIKETRKTTSARVAYLGTRQLILTVVRPLRALTYNEFRGGADEYPSWPRIRPEHQ